MAAPVPNSAETLPLLHTQNLIAACPAFQTLTGTVTEAAAKAKISLLGVLDPAAATRPYAIVGGPDGEVFDASLSAETNLFETRTMVALTFIADVVVGNPDIVDLVDQLLSFWNTVSAIMVEAVGLRGTSDGAGLNPRLSFNRYVARVPFLANEDDENDLPTYIQADYLIETDTYEVK